MTNFEQVLDEYITTPYWGNPKQEETKDDTIDYNLDDTGQIVFDYDLVEAITFHQFNLIDGLLIPTIFKKYVHLDNIGTIVDEYGIENIKKVEIMEGKTFLEMRLQEVINKNE